MIGTEGGSNAFHPDRSIFYCIILVIIYTYPGTVLVIYISTVLVIYMQYGTV